MFSRRMGRKPEPESMYAWTRAADRLRRAVIRYHDKVMGIHDRRVRIELLHIGEDLGIALTDFERAAAGMGISQGVDPQTGLQVLSGQDEVVLRAMGRAATLTQHAIEAALTAAEAHRHGHYDAVTVCLDSVRTLAKAVRELADVCRPPERG